MAARAEASATAWSTRSRTSTTPERLGLIHQRTRRSLNEPARSHNSTSGAGSASTPSTPFTASSAMLRTMDTSLP